MLGSKDSRPVFANQTSKIGVGSISNFFLEVLSNGSQVQVKASAQVPIALCSQTAWRDSSARPSGRSRTFRLRLHRLRKARSKMMLADFYGRVLVEPVIIEHDQSGFAAAIQQVRDAMTRHAIKDLIIVIERTGRYHEPDSACLRQRGI